MDQTPESSLEGRLLSADGGTASSRWLGDRIFNAAWAYDLAFGWDVSPEVATVLSIARPRAGGRVLVPACGTGRFALAFAERGFWVDASDINPEMLAVAAERRPHANVTYSLRDMAQSQDDAVADCDAAVTVCNSFRYILDESEVDGHLGFVRSRLRPGACYVAELALNVGDGRLVGGNVRWTVSYERWRAIASWTVIALIPPTATEFAEIRIEGADGSVHEFGEFQPQRLWTWDALTDVARRNGFDVVGAFLFGGRAAPRPTEPGRYYVALRRHLDEGRT
jgi:SAM-dependent methyltransferase